MRFKYTKYLLTKYTYMIKKGIQKSRKYLNKDELRIRIPPHKMQPTSKSNKQQNN